MHVSTSKESSIMQMKRRYLQGSNENFSILSAETSRTSPGPFHINKMQMSCVSQLKARNSVMQRGGLMGIEIQLYPRGSSHPSPQNEQPMLFSYQTFEAP